MNKVFLLVLAVALCFIGAQALECYQCTAGVGSLCVTSKVTCTSSSEHCFSGVGKAVGFLDIKSKGCLGVSECNKTSNVNFPTNASTLFSMTRTCCNTDLCNSAPDRSHVSALVMTLAAVAAIKFIM
ncbi:prostate stem cell antigen [Triplophysa rosa]|uniref:Sperm acrosome membrane-associated protein 4-like n=1 Tax=Triplophysa rosa TaxID=992332 RepID=A0A9W7WHC0_TRIRA|nr:prostate stem cell antigen [Triplophysa rosa]KAI7799110.1 putative sperm acrosome membrane-associated protein 4-like [Triplophysa rosa]